MVRFIRSFLFGTGLLVVVIPFLNSASVPAAETSSPNQYGRFFIRDISFEGNRAVSDGELRHALTIKQIHWYTIFRRKVRLTERVLQREVLALRNVYRSNGFLNPDISFDLEVGRKEDDIRIVVGIVEGRRTYCSGVEIRETGQPFFDKVRKQMEKIEVGKPLDMSRVQLSAAGIKRTYADNGYPFAKVRASLVFSADSSEATVVFDVDHGELMTISAIEVQRDTSDITRESVIMREFEIKPGDIYSRRKIIETQQNLYSTGLFDFVSLKPVPPPDSSSNLKLRLRITERPPNHVNFKFGAGQDLQRDLTFSASGLWGNRNLLGHGWKASAGVTSSMQAVRLNQITNYQNQFSFSVINPWFFIHHTPLAFELTYEPRTASATQEYFYDRLVAATSLTHEIRKRTTIRLAHNFEYIDIHDVPPEEQEIYRGELEIKVRRKLIFTVLKDTRGNLFFPTGGSVTKIEAEYVGGQLGGDINLHRYSFSWARYMKVRGSQVVATRIKTSWVDQFGGTDIIPAEDRLFLGGASSVRGYAENSLGPKYSAEDGVDPDVYGRPKGGTFYVVGNVEYRRNLFWRFGGTVFFDSGYLWEEPEDVEFADLRLTGGIGLQFFTPVGPFRLDYATRIIRADDPAEGRYHLSILYAF